MPSCVANASHFRSGVVDLFLLLRDLLVHARDRAIHDVLFFVDARALIDGDDLVRDVGRFLRVGVVDTDLEQIGVTDFVDIELAAQALIGLLLAWGGSRPSPICPAASDPRSPDTECRSAE